MNTKTKILAALSDGQAHTLTEKGYDIKNKIEYRKGKFFRSTYQLIK